MQVHRWRNVLILKHNLLPTISQSFTTTHFVSFHSTRISTEKWKSKFDSEFGKAQQSKNYARYVVRQKRSDAKRALNDLLFRCGTSKASLRDEERLWGFDQEKIHGPDNKRQSKHAFRNSGKFNSKKKKRWVRRESFSEDDGPETTFQATFGKRWHTWSFNKSSSERSTFGFDWREHPNQKHHSNKNWDSRCESDPENESCSEGLPHHRTILGLPASGPLKMEDVKNAFRMSALKWHPDKHQGPSQAAAEEKFKVCVNAYKSLCEALS